MNEPPRPSPGRIFLVFFRFGVTAFGGPAMIAAIRDLTVRRLRWVDAATFEDGLALVQSIPGATALQCASFVGLRCRGVAGGLAAYLGMGLPAFLLMVGLSILYAKTQSIAWMLALMRGLAVIVVALMAQATISFARTSARESGAVVIAALSAIALGLGLNPFYVILGAAAGGLGLFRKRSPLARPAPLAAALGQGVRQALPLFLVLCAVVAATWCYRRELFSLVMLMLGINCVSFAGGMAALPIMYRQIVEVDGLMSAKMFMDGIALGQITPGPISITATFLGYMLFGLIGSVAATVAMFAPSFLALVMVDPAFKALLGSRGFYRASRGIAASFVGLLAYMTVKFTLDITWDPQQALLLILGLTALWRGLKVVWVVLFAAVYALILL